MIGGIKQDPISDDLGGMVGGIKDMSTNEPVVEREDDEIEDIQAASESTADVMQLPEVTGWNSTGIFTLDLAISNRPDGGVPEGRVIHCYGGGSTAKTVLLTTILGYAIRNGKEAHMGDVEHTLDPHFAGLYGLDCTSKHLHMHYPETLEQMFDDTLASIVYKGTKKKKEKGEEKAKLPIDTTPKVVGVDSVTALPSESELDKSMSEGSYDLTRAKQMSKGFRKYLFPIATSNTTLFCIDQTRDAVGVLFGKKEVTSGGRALEFYSSVQIYLRHDSNIVNSKGVCIGIWVKFKIEKNKVAPPFREGRFKILFDYGIDDIATNLYFLTFHTLGEKKAKEKTAKLELFGEEHTQAEWIKIIERDGREQDLRAEVYKLWQEIYKIDQRKPRVW